MLPRERRLPDQLEIRLMHQRRRLERVARAFMAEALTRHGAQLIINGRQQPRRRLLVLADRSKE